MKRRDSFIRFITVFNILNTVIVITLSVVCHLVYPLKSSAYTNTSLLASAHSIAAIAPLQARPISSHTKPPANIEWVSDIIDSEYPLMYYHIINKLNGSELFPFDSLMFKYNVSSQKIYAVFGSSRKLLSEVFYNRNGYLTRAIIYNFNNKLGTPGQKIRQWDYSYDTHNSPQVFSFRKVWYGHGGPTVIFFEAKPHKRINNYIYTIITSNDSLKKTFYSDNQALFITNRKKHKLIVSEGTVRGVELMGFRKEYLINSRGDALIKVTYNELTTSSPNPYAAGRGWGRIERDDSHFNSKTLTGYQQGDFSDKLNRLGYIIGKYNFKYNFVIEAEEPGEIISVYKFTYVKGLPYSLLLEDLRGQELISVDETQVQKAKELARTSKFSKAVKLEFCYTNF